MSDCHGVVPAFEQRYRTLQRDRAELAANGLGGPGCTPNGAKDFDFRHFPGPAGGLLPTFWNVANGAIGDGLTQTFFPGFVFMSRESLSLALTSNNHGRDGCQFYNPYLTALTNPALANSQELADWMSPELLRADKRNAPGVLPMRTLYLRSFKIHWKCSSPLTQPTTTKISRSGALRTFPTVAFSGNTK